MNVFPNSGPASNDSEEKNLPFKGPLTNFKGDRATTSQLPCTAEAGDFYIIPVIGGGSSSIASGGGGPSSVRDDHLWAWDAERNMFIDIGSISSRTNIYRIASSLESLDVNEKKTTRRMKPSRAPRISRFYTKRFKYQ